MNPSFSASLGARDTATTACHETLTVKTVRRLDSGEAICFGTPSSRNFGPGMLSFRPFSSGPGLTQHV